MPAVTEPPRPKGLPTASTQSPTRALSLSANFTAFSGFSGFTFSTATSTFWSLPITSALSFCPSVKMTVTSLASAMTWLLVMTMPEASMTKPEPSEADLRWRGSSGAPWPCCWRRLRNSSNNSSKGVEGWPFGAASLPRFWSTVCVAEMLTTASCTVAARSASELGPLARAGVAASGPATSAPTSPAARARLSVVKSETDAADVILLLS